MDQYNLIPNAFTVYSDCYAKIGEIGYAMSDPEVQDSARHAQLKNQLITASSLFYTVTGLINLNDDGDEIIGINADAELVNSLLLNLKDACGLNAISSFPTPFTTINFNNANPGQAYPVGGLGAILQSNGLTYLPLEMGAPGEVLTSSPSGLVWSAVVGNGIPSGGTTGQALLKTSGTSYDVAWYTLTPASIGVSSSVAELDILNGATISTAELNTLTGINTGSSLADQLAAKMSSSLANGSFFVGNGSGVATAVAPTGDVTFNNTGVFAIGTGVIVDADVSASAAISRSKLASGNQYRIIVNDNTGVMSEAPAMAASRVIVSNANGTPVASGVSTTTIGFLDATSSVQTQLNSKLTVTLTSPAQGAMLYYNGSAWINFAVGTAGQVLTSTGSIPQWGSATANGLPTGGTTNQYLRKIDATNYNTEWHTFVLADVTDVVTTVTELNLLSGLTATSTELNLTVGGTSAFQGQIESKLNNSLAHHAIWVGGGGNTPQQYGPGTEGSILTIVAGHPIWQSAPSPGDVTGPASSTDKAIVRWNTTTGDAIQDSGVIIDDTNNITGVTTLSSGQISVLNQAAVRLYETGSTNYVGLRAAGTMGADYTITLPAAAPASNTFLMYDGADYVWNAGGGAGTIGGTIASTQVAFGTGADTIGGNATFLFNSTDNRLTVPILNASNASDVGANSGDLWYNSTLQDYRAIINGEIIGITRPLLKTIDNTDSPYTIQESDRNGIIYADTSGGNITIDLQGGTSDGHVVTFINTGTGDVILSASGGYTLEAIDTTCSTQYGWVSVLLNTTTSVYSASGALGAGGGGGGTVTSVAMSVPSFLSVAGSPVTTTGTFAVTLATQTANTVFAGPTTGSAAAPTFRALVTADIPDLSSIYLTGNQTITLSGDVSGSGATAITTTLATVNGNVGSFGSATQVGLFTVNAKGLITAASNVTVTPAVGSITGLGTGVATALAVNIGTAGSFVVNGGVLGTPSSGTLTNATGLPVSTGISGLGTGVATWLATPSWTNFNSAITGTAPFWALTGTSTFTGNVTIARGTSTQTYTNTASSTSVDEMTISGGGMAASSGSNHLFRGIVATPTYNMTGTASASNIRWLDYNPTVTSLTGTTHYAATFRLGTIMIGASVITSSIQHSLDIDAGAYSGAAIRVTQAATGGAAAITFGRGTTDVGYITGTGSTAGVPNALYFRTSLAGGNMAFATAINTVAMTISSSQKVGIGPTSLTPTAWLHIQAGTATANTAPIKLNTGTALTTPEDGAIEYHSSHLYFTIGSTRYQLDQQGGGGITNSGAADEIVKSDGTNIVGTGSFSTSSGNMVLGSGALAGNRSISIASSATDAWLSLAGKGAGGVRTFGVFLVGNSGEYTDPDYENRSIYMSALGSDYRITGGNGDSGVAKDFTIKAADGFNTNANGRSLNLISGEGDGTGTDGNVVIDTLTGYLMISTIPTSSAGLPSGAVWSNAGVLTIV